MPTYDYECKDCGYTFEKFQSMSDDTLVTCPKCKKDSLRRLIGGGMGIIFKGSGFYINDSKSKSSSTVPVQRSEAKENTASESSTPKSGASDSVASSS